MIGDSCLKNEFNIGIIIDIRASGHHNHLIGHFYVLCAGVHILRRGHTNKEEGLSIAEGHVGPTTNGAHTLHRCNSIVCHQNLHYKNRNKLHVKKLQNPKDKVKIFPLYPFMLMVILSSFVILRDFVINLDKQISQPDVN